MKFENFYVSMNFLCEEAKIKQHIFSKKELCEIDEEAIWESRFTCFSGNITRADCFDFYTSSMIPRESCENS